MKTIMLAVMAGSLCSMAAAQQSEGDGATSTPEPKKARFFDTEIGLNADYAFRADVDGGGDVAVTRSMLSFDVSHSFTPDFHAGLLMTSEISWYDFDNATGLIAGTGKPFSQMLETDITPHFACKVNDQWTALSGVFFRFAGETNADLGDTFTWGGYVAGRYTASKEFSVTLGVRANSRLEDNWAVLPAIGMDWNVSPTVRVQLLPAVGGEGLRVTSVINQQLSFLIDCEYQTRAFRMEDGAPLPDGVVRDSRVTVGMGVLWKPRDKVEIVARAGAVAWQEFTIDNSDGVQQTSTNTDPTPYIFLGGNISF